MMMTIIIMMMKMRMIMMIAVVGVITMTMLVDLFLKMIMNRLIVLSHFLRVSQLSRANYFVTGRVDMNRLTYNQTIHIYSSIFSHII